MVLPKGFVCKNCNNGVLARLDEVLRNCPFFAIQRVLYVPFDKKGKLPKARLGTTTLKKSSPTNIQRVEKRTCVLLFRPR